ncbi:MAG: dephospho-CoA kinase [Phycisphaerae bacterium]
MAGGVGAGKSAVAAILVDLGAGVVDSDALGREEINAPEVKAALCRWWTPAILDTDGGVDRAKVATIVFGDSVQRRRLEALLHPRIAARRAELLSRMNDQSDVRMIVLDSPLLYETDLDLECDAVIFVDADRATRLQRSEKSRHWSKEQFTRREKSQQSLDMKRARADYVCGNHSTLAELRESVTAIFAQIVSTTVAF